MTFLQLCQALRQDCGVQGTGPSTVVGQVGILKRIVDYVANADEYIQNLYADWGFLRGQTWTRTTVAGTETYTADAVLGFWDTESFMLNRGLTSAQVLPVRPYVRRKYHRDNSKPSYVMVHDDGSVVLNAPADAAYALSGDYFKKPTKMTANSDNSLIPSQFRRIILVRAKMWFAEDEELPQMYQTALAEYRDMLSRLEAHSLPGQRWRSQAQATEMVVRPG